MSRRLLFIAIVVTALLGCSQYSTELRVSDRVQFVEYFPYQDRARNLVSAVPSRQIIVVDRKRIEVKLPNAVIDYVFDECDSVFLIVQNDYGSFVGLLDRDGNIDYLCDLIEVGPESITGLKCKKSGRKMELSIKYSLVNQNFVQVSPTLRKIVTFSPL